jgi:hypothetical protein
MANEEVLSREIEELEGKMFGKRGDAGKQNEPTEPVEVKEEVEVSEGITPNEESPKEQPTESVETTTQEEDTFTETEEANKPTRTNWKKKYEQLDKRFRNLKTANDSTIFTLRTDLKNALESQESLSDKVDELSKQLAEAKVTEADNFKDILSSEEQEIIGVETLDALQKLNKVNTEAQVAPLKERLERAEKKSKKESKAFAENNAEQARLNFLERLGNVVPDYADIDTDPKFLEYMSEQDEFSGSIRKDLFLRAKDIGDVGRVAQFLLDFKKLRDAGKETLQRKVTPTSSASNAQPTKQQPKQSDLVSMKKVNEFMTNVQKGKIKDQKLIERVMSRIDAAQRAGKIVA